MISNVPTNDVTRIELIGPDGTVFSTWKAKDVIVSLQDNAKTLKIFFNENEGVCD